MSNLIVCCDGTWNTREQQEGGLTSPTNVVRLYNALANVDSQGKLQDKYYHSGVGAEGNLVERLLGGGVGRGLSQNIQSAYKWLCSHYHTGDNIFLFGFSRGSFTVRSLAGMILHCGLLNTRKLPETDRRERIDKAFQAYRNNISRDQWAGSWEFHNFGDSDHEPIIHFLGVWDTVGALGIPDDLGLLNLLDKPQNYAFHNTELKESIHHARHAVAMDEMRGSFSPTLWNPPISHPDAKELWFPGVHCDVGGAYLACGLSDAALAWMMDEAEQQGLCCNPAMRSQLQPNYQGGKHDTLSYVYEKILYHQPRNVPNIGATSSFHASATRRHQDPPINQAPYWRTVDLLPGQSKRVTIYARKPWNRTCIYLDAGGEYAFKADGLWKDFYVESGAEGVTPGWSNPKHWMYLLAQQLELIGRLLQACTLVSSLKLGITRREPDKPWFSLVGVVANGGNPQLDGTPAPHETFLIGRESTFKVQQPGYMWCFANDCWHGYGNNQHSTSLLVTRIL